MATIIRGFNPMTDRYAFDTGRCSYKNGWAQLDTGQDASYYGTWINPDLLTIVSYCEGDIITMQCASSTELVEEVARIKAWNVEGGYGFGGIDVLFSEELTAKYKAIGLEEYLH
jgi:hypothetical protein